MHAYNNYIDLKEERIYNYDIILILDDSSKIEDDNIDKLNFIESLTKVFFKILKYTPNASDIIDIIYKLRVRDLSTYSNFLQNNNKLYKNQKYELIDDSCLITVCFDELDKDWIIRNSNIFSQIYIISYKKYEVDLENVHIIYSKNSKSKFVFDVTFLSNDLKVYFNKLFYLNNGQNIALLNNKTFDFNIELVSSYIKNLKILRENFVYCKTLVNIKDNLYEIHQNNYFYIRNKFLNFSSSTSVKGLKKAIKSPLILIINIFNKVYLNESGNMINALFPDNIYEINPPYLIEKYLAESSKFIHNKTEKEIYDFFEKNFKITEFKNEKQKKMIIRSDNQLSPYDFQFYDNSIIVFLENEIKSDIILLCYIYNLCKEYQKKMFLKWDDRYKNEDIIEDYFYILGDCNDKLEFYDVKYYDNKNNDDLIISSNDIVSIVSTKNINIDNRFYGPIKSTLSNIKWSSQIMKFLKYLTNDCKIDLNKIVCVDIHTKFYHLINKIIEYNDKHIILMKKNTVDNLELKYTEVPLKDDNIIHSVIQLILLNHSYGLINEGQKDKFHKIIYDDDEVFNVNRLLSSNEYLLVDNFNGTITRKYMGISKKQIYNQGNIMNGILFILTNDNYNSNIIDSLSDISFIDEIFIITDKSSFISKNYKVKVFKSALAKNIIINNIIKKSKFDKILISDFPVNTLFFNFYELNGKEFFVNRSRNLCFFDIKQAFQLNGFNEHTNEYIYDFSERLEQRNYKKFIIDSQFDKSEKKYLKLEKELKSWGKEFNQTILNIRKQNGIYVLFK